MNECLNELQCIEHGEIRQQVRLRAANALLAAVENSNDAVEITNEDNEIEVRDAGIGFNSLALGNLNEILDM